MPDTSLLIVAHPDDEVLWFSSILCQVSKVIIAFKDYDAAPGLGARRAAAMAELPYATLACLGIAEAGSFKRASWDNPKPTRFGLALDEGVPGSEPRRRFAGRAPATGRRPRTSGFTTLRAGSESYRTSAAR